MNSTAHQPIVYIISAPSGSGKSTLVNKLLRLLPNLDFSISYTTRTARGSEQNEKQYYFVSRSEFERMIASDEFLEYAEVFGNYYGTSRRFLQQAERTGRDLLLDIDVQGAAQIKRRLPAAISIFILPPDRRTLERRLRGRGEDREDVIQRRLVTASREIENYDKYDFILVNDELEKSTGSLDAIVRSVRLQRSGRALSKEEQSVVDFASSCLLQNVRAQVQPILASFSAPVSSGP